MDHEFYVNGDDGYYSLCCNDCHESIVFIEAGSFLGAITIEAEAHVCKVT